MAHRIAVVSKVDDAGARTSLHHLTAIFPKSALHAVTTTTLYTIDAKLSARELQRIGERLANPLIETFAIDAVPISDRFAYAIEIGFLPGVTDNVGRTTRETIEDCLGRSLGTSAGVYSSALYFLIGAVSARDAKNMARELHNPLIERASVYAKGTRRFPIVVPNVKVHAATRAHEVDLHVSDAELSRIGKEGIADHDGARRGPLALSIDALKTIRAYFDAHKRNPTDVELEALAQTWSEHCKHRIFADPLDNVKEGIYRRYIKGATEKIREKKRRERSERSPSHAARVEGDICISVFKDNAGAIAFDEKYLVTHKVETHNSPSALDPFGGAVTAIVGVNRDCIGFGLGAKPIANTYGFCVADPTETRELYRDRSKRQPLLPARRILEGVVKGINAGGNQSGIPTPLGFVAVDPSFRGKPLVFGGTVGLIPRRLTRSDLKNSPRSDLKKARPGDYIVMVGGRVGLDGIHGATFSSESLVSGSPATAVQIGDPITQKKLSDALIREARDAGLYSSITDNGAGGLSSSVGEMARESGGPSPRRSGLSPRRSLRRSTGRPREGGCLVELEKVPLKYPGLAPWQIWLSESQERMTLAVPKRKWQELKKLFDRHDVEATRIGEFSASGSCVVRFGGKKVMDISLGFLHEGRPVINQKSKKAIGNRQKAIVTENVDLRQAILDVLARPSIGSISFISRQYDYEVQGTSVTKPLQGRGCANADAAVLKPLANSSRGILLSHGYCPWYSEIDTYAMAAAAIDTAVRNAIAAGASRDYLALLDNFCWSSSEKPERLYELKEAARACYDITVAYGTPFISGKDSMFNDFRGFDAHGKPVDIAALPMLLISAIGVIPDVSRAMTIDFKTPGDSIYLVGETNDELGASEYSKAGSVPRVDARKNARVYDAIAGAIQGGLVASAIGVGRGGLAVALGKSAIAGQFGMKVDLSDIPGSARTNAAVLFSESQGRFIISVRKGSEKRFEALFRGVSHARIGEVSDTNSVSIAKSGGTIELNLRELTTAYRSFFKQW